MSDPTVEFLSAKEVVELRRQAQELANPPEGCPEGWCRRPDDPAKILAMFGGLGLKTGFVLRAYQFIQGGNGNGVVWALPEGADFPDLVECERLEGRFLNPPRPAEALDDFREVIEGDGSPLSYLFSSLASRELWEFGARWHGVSWGSVEILGSDPWDGDQPFPDHHSPAYERDWAWNDPKPEDWRPRVEVGRESAVVTLQCYSGLGRDRIFRLTDRYTFGSYVFKWDQHEVAVGPGGYVH